MKAALLAGLMVSGLLLAPSAHACQYTACPDIPTPIDFDLNNIEVYQIHNPLFYQQSLTTGLEFSVPNNPDQAFEATALYRAGEYGGDNYNLSVTADISGHVPIGEQYNDFTFVDFPGLGTWGEVYNDIGVTPEAFLVTPFGNVDFPSAFVEAVGPTFFEPWASVGMY